MKPLICCLLLFTGVFAQLPSSFTPTLSSTAEASRVAPSDAKATTLLMQANLALTGGQAPSDGIFTGTVALPDGEKVANGSVTLKLKGSGESRMDISATDKGRSEVLSNSKGAAGSWKGPDGVAHEMAWHNSLVPSAWFAPHAVIAGMSGSDVTLSYIGEEERNGIKVDHIRYKRQLPVDPNNPLPKFAMDPSTLTVVNLYLDQVSHRPLAIEYNLHPDKNANRNIPVEVRYADYRATNGIQAPFRIQRLINHSLNLDLTLTSASLNAGLPESDFAVK
jgi:hypothetical protein